MQPASSDSNLASPHNPFAAEWTAPRARAERMAEGRRLRARLPRRSLAGLTLNPARDPLGILEQQNRTRLQDLIPLRAERMAAHPFAFYRGTAAIMAADLAAHAHSGMFVASCGDAHVANFGLFASPQRTLVFDLNDFDEAAWAPWEWDLKRLVTSIVIAGQAGSRVESAIRKAVLTSVRAYATALWASSQRNPVQNYFTRMDAEIGNARGSETSLDEESLRVLSRAVAHAKKRTGERAVSRLTRIGDEGRLVFVQNPPTMTALAPEIAERARGYMQRYLEAASADVRLLMRHYSMSDAARRVVGVGSVGTRCALVLLQDGDGNALIMQSKEAGRSVLEEYGGIAQPAELVDHIAAHGEGGRVVALQRVLQAVSDPLLGHLRSTEADLYVRQFHDMKGGIDAETLDDAPFADYAQACAVTLARAHGQSPTSVEISGYIGRGNALGHALLEWGYSYAALSSRDFEQFIAAR